MSPGASDPEVRAMVAEYALMVETGMTPQDIDGLDYDRAVLFMALAEHIQGKRVEAMQRRSFQSWQS